MKRSLTLCIVALFAGYVCSSFAADAKLSSGDESFLKKAAQGGMMEVKLGEIASSNAKRQDVKDFGAKMVKDHGAANAELKTLAGAKGVGLPENLGTLHQNKVDKLSKLQGDQFDGAYVKEMVEDHSRT